MCLLTSNTESCDEDVEEVGVGVEEELVDKPGTTNGTWFGYIAINALAIFGEMWFLNAGPVVGIPMVLTEFPQGKHSGSFFKKHNFDEQVQFFDIFRGFFSGLHLADGRHHRRRTPRCPHGLQLSRVKVSFTDHAHLLQIQPQTLLPPALLLTQPGVPILPRASRM